MKFKTLKYFSTVLVFAVALCAGWWMWNYYMQSPWTRDGKVRAEIVDITPEVSGRITDINVHDNQFVKSGTLLFVLDSVPYQISLDNAQAALAKAAADLDKANHEAQRRRGLAANIISAESLDESNISAKAMKAQYQAAQASLEQAQWNLSKTKINAPTDGYITICKPVRATTPQPVRRLSDWWIHIRFMYWVILKRPNYAILKRAVRPILRCTTVIFRCRARSKVSVVQYMTKAWMLPTIY